MSGLAGGEFGRLLFRALLGGRKLCLKGFDMGFERPDNLIGQRSPIWIAEALSAAVNPNGVVPALRRPDPRALVISKRLLPSAARRPSSNRLGRHAQQVRCLPVGKPFTRQNCPPSVDVGTRRQRAAQQGL